MKAIIWTKYGPPESLQLQEVARPTPKVNEVLVKIHAVTASTPDTEIRRLKLPLLFAIPIRLYLGLFKPSRVKILGADFAGEIVSIGKEVSRYQVGDRVFGYTGLALGTYAEYMCIAEKPAALASVMTLAPNNLSYEEAAAIAFGGLEAFQVLRQVHIEPGHNVLIVGAGGSIGSYAVQLAKHHGANVTGVDKAVKLEMLRAIGADHVIDYAREDFTKKGQKYDVILDTIGGSPFVESINSLTDNGTYLNANPGFLGRIRMRAASRNTHKKILAWSGDYSAKSLAAVKELAEAGTIKAVIDRRYPLEEIVEAHRYVESGDKKGNVVIRVESAS